MQKMIQQPLFDCTTYNIERVMKETLCASAKNSGLSREDIVERMNFLADRFGVSMVSGKNGNGLSIDVFEKWLNPADLTRQMPIRALPIFCRVVEDTSAIDVIAKPLGLAVIGPEAQQKLAWAEANLAIKHHRKKIKKLEEALS